MRSPERPGRILIITFAYAPMVSARAFRWTALAEDFAASGWQVDVVTCWMPGAAESEVRGGVRIHRAGWRRVERLRRMVRDTRGQEPQPAAGSREAPAPGIAARLLQFLREHLWRRLYWPDTSCLWYWPARRAAIALVRAYRHDAIVSVSPTFSAVLVGRAAHRAYPKSRWILDFGDPFSLQEEAPPNNTALYGSLNRRVERDALSRADAISVTTPETAARYAAAFPESARKLHVIPPLLSIPEAGAETPLFAQDGVVRFVYVGTLYRGLREPQFMLDLFELLCARGPGVRRELHLFGDAHAFAELLAERQRSLGAALRVHGTVPRETVARAVRGADVLVNIGNATRDQIPSKVVEYAASGKPILNIARSTHDSSTEFLRDYPATLTILDRGEKPTDAQLEALIAFLGGPPRRVTSAEIDAWLAPYRIARIGASYRELLQ